MFLAASVLTILLMICKDDKGIQCLDQQFMMTFGCLICDFHKVVKVKSPRGVLRVAASCQICRLNCQIEIPEVQVCPNLDQIMNFIMSQRAHLKGSAA